MPGQPTPPLMLQAFAKNAAAPFIQNPIPNTTADPERASLDIGFPPQTMQTILAGGTPPYGQDVNGILYMISAHAVAAQAGQPYLYNSTLATSMGGYAKGIILGMSDSTGLWVNTVSGNTTDPDGGSAAGWLPVYSYGFQTMSGLTGGTVTLTPAQYRRGVIVLAGTLAGNLQVILPSGTVGQRSWLIVNTTSGAFSTIVKTAAGTGVTVPQGGYSAPVEVYGDGTNIYPKVAPVSLPIDQNPTPSTIAQRTNAGYLFATYFNQNSSVENFTMAAVYADAGDGYHRKIAPANFAAQISLSQFAGQVVAGQVPAAAVTQYAALILANAALTGTPTAPTPSVGDASTKVATTAFVNPGQSIGTNGYTRLPNGLIFQWGTNTGGSGAGTQFIAFPLTFPNACLNVTATLNGRTSNAGDNTDCSVSGLTAGGFTAYSTTNNSGNRSVQWFAVGY